MGNLYWSKGGSLQQLCSSSSGMQEGGYELRPTDYIIATGELQPLIYEEAVNRTAQKHLYEKLTENDSLTQDSVMENFVMESAPLALGEISELEAQQGSIWELSQSESYIFAGYREGILHYTDSIAFVDSMMRISPSGDISYLLAQKQGYIQALQSFIAINDSSIQQVLQQKNAERLDIKDGFNSMVLNKQYEQNEQAVNQIFLETVAQGVYSFDSIQSSILQLISGQCPISGGRAVYGARVLLSITNPLATYNDKAICNQQGVPYRIKNNTSEGKANLFKVYPNPADKTLKISCNKSMEGETLFRISNTLGMRVSEISLENGGAAIEVSTLPEGAYFGEVLLDNQVVYSQIILIVHH